MKSARDLFQKISYLQYPLYLVGLFYVFLPLTNKLSTLLHDYNMALIFYGLGISFSTLQDTTKSQNNFSKKIWESPTRSKVFLVYIGLFALIFTIAGIIGLLAENLNTLHELAFGLVSLGVGLLGVLKSGMEMAEHHQKKTEQEKKC